MDSGKSGGYPNKVDFQSKLIRRDKEEYFLLLKGTIIQEDITIVNIYVLNNTTCMYINENLLNSGIQIDHNTIILGDFNTQVSTLDRYYKQKLNKETMQLNNAINNLT